jgi:hypothetical protein
MHLEEEVKNSDSREDGGRARPLLEFVSTCVLEMRLKIRN